MHRQTSSISRKKSKNRLVLQLSCNPLKSRRYIQWELCRYAIQVRIISEVSQYVLLEWVVRISIFGYLLHDAHFTIERYRRLLRFLRDHGNYSWLHQVGAVTVYSVAIIVYIYICIYIYICVRCSAHHYCGKHRGNHILNSYMEMVEARSNWH